MRRRVAEHVAWAVVAAWPFWELLFGGRVLYFRDISSTYYPDLHFVEQALRRGVWPLWHPGADAGAPFLACYPVHLLLVLLAGAKATLALSPWLHVLLAMAGCGALGRRLKIGADGCWIAGCVYGLSGYMLGAVLCPVFLAAAWAPLVVALALSVLESPTPRRVAALAVAAALEASTFGVEVLPQTALLAVALMRGLPRRRAALALAGAGVLAAALATPVLVGAAWLMRGTARGEGFGPQVGFSYSAPLPVLLEAVLPRFLGDPHAFSDVGYWGQPFFSAGSPYFLSLYLGPVVLVLALRAGGSPRRLWMLALLGALLAAGAHGPLAIPLAPAMQLMRAPVKFFMLATLALALLAGHGVERAICRWRPAVLPGLLFLGVALWARLAPENLSRALALLTPEAGSALARDVIGRSWPADLALSGALALASGLALALGGRRPAFLAGLIALLDLARVNVPLNPATQASFYDLRPSVREVVEEAEREGRFRWYSFGAEPSRLTWSPAVAARRSDVWLYFVERQALIPRMHVLDGLEGAFDVDRMGLAPTGATLEVWEAQPRLFHRLEPRLRLGNVRWVLSFEPLPGELVRERRTVPLPELKEPLRLYELRRALPRAFFAREIGSTPPEPDPSEPWSVEYASPDPHTVSLRCRTPPGFVVVLDGHHPDWRARDGSEPVELLRVAGRYRALRTPGGDRRITLRFEPPWVRPALLLALAAAAISIALSAVRS